VTTATRLNDAIAELAQLACGVPAARLAA